MDAEGLKKQRINLQSAVIIIRDYFTVGGHQDEVDEAFIFLQKEYPKTGPVIRAFRNHIFTDDMFEQEHKTKICWHYFGELVRKLSVGLEIPLEKHR